MSAFTDAEIEFVNSQRLGRLATVGADGMPHVVPVAVFYDPDADALVVGANVEFGEAVMTSSKKFRDAQRRPKAAVVIDDPGPRILEVRGQAETYLDGGEEAGRRVGAPFRFASAWIRVRPRRIVAVGINGGRFESSARDTELLFPGLSARLDRWRTSEAAHLPDAARRAAIGQARNVASARISSVTRALGTGLRPAAEQAFSHGYQVAVLIAGPGLIAAAIIAAFGLRDNGRHEPGAATGTPAPPGDLDNLAIVAQLHHTFVTRPEGGLSHVNH
jgi:pyridoxamine 5'-phosphate oxidase family protein